MIQDPISDFTSAGKCRKNTGITATKFLQSTRMNKGIFLLEFGFLCCNFGRSISSLYRTLEWLRLSQLKLNIMAGLTIGGRFRWRFKIWLQGFLSITNQIHSSRTNV
jgi:hypothetical protein